jgi:hypothetical protein
MKSPGVRENLAMIGRITTVFAASLRALATALLILLCCTAPGFAQDVPPSAHLQTAGTTTSLFLARGAESVVSPYVNNMHYLEFLQIRKRWIFPDVGYVDFGKSNYRELFIGGGRTLIQRKRVTWEQEMLYVQAFGQAAHDARYLQPWSLLDVQFTRKVSSETSYFLYIPLNNPAQLHHVLERAKVEYAVASHWKIGAGYAALKFAASPLQNKPLVTTTWLTKAGSFELWLQRIPAGVQVQLRYVLIRESR